jgi:hypothetical protein
MSFETFLRQERKRFFSADGAPATAKEISDAQSRLGVELPPSYRLFQMLLGPGEWCGDVVPHVDELYAFDNVWEMTGFVSLVHNVRGVGDYLAINPADGTRRGERPLYFCSHDPFGYAVIALSFETWARLAAASSIEHDDLYESVGDQVYMKNREYEAMRRATRAAKPGKWWQVWRRGRT